VRADRLYFEDVEVNTVLESPGITVTEAHVGFYAGLTGDLAPMHGAVPDLLPLTLTTGLGWRVPQPPLVVLAFLGVEWEMLRPLAVGDTMFGRSRFLSKRPMRDGGLIVEAREVVDQRGEVVQRGRFTYLVAKRAKEARA
jgi:acyl dehydratase